MQMVFKLVIESSFYQQSSTNTNSLIIPWCRGGMRVLFEIEAMGALQIYEEQGWLGMWAWEIQANGALGPQALAANEAPQTPQPQELLVNGAPLWALQGNGATGAPQSWALEVNGATQELGGTEGTQELQILADLANVGTRELQTQALLCLADGEWQQQCREKAMRKGKTKVV